MYQPNVSVIIPCFNQGKFLQEAIESVLNQTFQDSEIIVINDGSSDNTHDVLRKYLCHMSMRCLWQKHQGLSKARNVGLAMAKGKYIQFLDADDLLLPNKLKLQVALLEKKQFLDAVYCNFWCVSGKTNTNIPQYASPKLLGADFFTNLILRWERGFSIPIHCFLFRSTLFSEIRFDESLPNHEDWDLYIRLAASRFNTHMLAESLAVYRIHKNSMSRNHILMNIGWQQVLNRTSRISSYAKTLVLKRENIEAEDLKK